MIPKRLWLHTGSVPLIALALSLALSLGCSPGDPEDPADPTEPDAPEEFKPSDHRPVFSPDGSHIVFMSNRFDEDWEMFRIDRDGSNLTRLTEHPGWDGYAVFEPGGTRFVYDREDDGVKRPYLFDLASGETRPFLTMDDVWASVNDWQPDGARAVLFIERDEKRDLYLVDVDGGNLEQITDTPEPNEHDAHFSPDGRWLAFAVKMESGSALDVMDLKTGEIMRMVESTQYLYGLDWSPDGTRIAYTDTPNDQPDGNAELYVIDFPTGDTRQLTTNDDYDHMPVWLPDGSGVLFSSYRSGTEELYVLDLATMEVDPFLTGLPRASQESTRSE